MWVRFVRLRRVCIIASSGPSWGPLFVESTIYLRKLGIPLQEGDGYAGQAVFILLGYGLGIS